MDRSSPEYEAMVYCNALLVEAVETVWRTIAEALFAARLITEEIAEASPDRDPGRACLAVDCVRGNVQQDPERIHAFIVTLRDSGCAFAAASLEQSIYEQSMFTFLCCRTIASY